MRLWILLLLALPGFGQEPTEMLRRLLTAMHKGDHEEGLPYFTEDAVHYMPTGIASAPISKMGPAFWNVFRGRIA